MNKQQAQEWMSRALDGELSAAEQAELNRYLAEHPEHLADQAEWRQVGDLLRAEPADMPTAEAMWADVQRALRVAEPEPLPAWSGWRLKWASAFTGLALVGLGLWAALQSRPPSGQTAQAVAAPVVEWAEAELPGTSTMVYEDAERDTVVIWLMAENGAETPKGS
jgi:anti-sigma factor RsiW